MNNEHYRSDDHATSETNQTPPGEKMNPYLQNRGITDTRQPEIWNEKQEMFEGSEDLYDFEEEEYLIRLLD